ncbi:MAG: GGDEF domain-containing protein [Lachnospiraceae bacterium]
MDFSEEIINFVSNDIGGIVVIAEGSSEIVYADKFFTEKYGNNIVGLYADEIFNWMQDCPKLSLDAPAVEWENIDTDRKKYYKFNSAMFRKEEKNYLIHQITDITEYMSLNRDITKYMSFFKKLSSFQTAILEKLSNSYQELLPMIADYFKTSKAYFFIERDEYMEIVSFAKMGKIFSNDRIAMSDEVAGVFDTDTADDILLTGFAPSVQDVLKTVGGTEETAYCMLCNGNVSGQRFAIYLNVWPNMDRDSMAEKTLVSVIKLYAENALMREKLIYENEHDHLTGLYNKGKYLERIEEEYPNQSSIAIFNFDVNNLKKMNDEFGHEAGDKLIIKAADSIRKVTSNNIHGYRMGGDEFLMVACDVTKDEADTLKKRWEDELERLNTLSDDINCVMALGMTYGEGKYDLSKLLSEADELMYEDKKAKKKPGEEIR